MNCQEVQLQLSGYLEKSLDAIRMKGIETHLGSCPFCRVEARALADCIAMVAALPPVEPPPGFTQRIMAHAREIDLELPVWQRWFGVFRTTVPIQASAVLMIAVFAVVMYQREPALREKGFTESSPPPVALQTVPAPESVAAPAISSARETVAEPSVAGAPARRRPTDPGSAVTAPPLPSAAEPAGAARRAPATPDIPVEFPRVAPRRAPIQAQEISTGREPARPRADVFGFGASIGAVDRQPYGVAPFVVGRAPSPLSEPRADFEFIVRRRALERREAAENAAEAAPKRIETDAAIASAAAQRTVPAPGGASSAIVEVRWFAVAPHHLDEFRKELAAEATIDSEKGPAGGDQSTAGSSPRNLLIKVVILPSDR